MAELVAFKAASPALQLMRRAATTVVQRKDAGLSKADARDIYISIVGMLNIELLTIECHVKLKKPNTRFLYLLVETRKDINELKRILPKKGTRNIFLRMCVPPRMTTNQIESKMYSVNENITKLMNEVDVYGDDHLSARVVKMENRMREGEAAFGRMAQSLERLTSEEREVETKYGTFEEEGRERELARTVEYLNKQHEEQRALIAQLTSEQRELLLQQENRANHSTAYAVLLSLALIVLLFVKL